MIDLSTIPVAEWLKLNASLQLKKNRLRAELATLGILKREGENKFDKYSYFSEAQYKALFTELFSRHGLELKFDELAYDTYEGTEKQQNGRMPRICFYLMDVETGFYEATAITAEGMDKGDKAGYKAYTGALKYFLADTFMVATGDDPEKDSPEQTANVKQERPAASPAAARTASPRQIEVLLKWYQGENLAKLLAANGIAAIEQLPMAKASELIQKLTAKAANEQKEGTEA